MKDIRRFENNQLFGVKARDYSVRTGTKVATLGGFEPNGSVRPGFRVNFTSTEGVAGAAQVIRFENADDARRWINEKRREYGYDEDEMSVMNSRAAEYVRLPLCNFATDVWVNSCILNRLSPRALNGLHTYCPQYIDDETPNDPQEETPHYRGFRF